ncbi:hypothetical protein H5410_045883, partial [Solanum commersonii]
LVIPSKTGEFLKQEGTWNYPTIGELVPKYVVHVQSNLHLAYLCNQGDEALWTETNNDLKGNVEATLGLLFFQNWNSTNLNCLLKLLDGTPLLLIYGSVALMEHLKEIMVLVHQSFVAQIVVRESEICHGVWRRLVLSGYLEEIFRMSKHSFRKGNTLINHFQKIHSAEKRILNVDKYSTPYIMRHLHD